MNHIDPPSFADRLMKSEAGDDELRRRYEEGKLALMERRVAPWQRRLAWLGLPLYGALIFGCGYRILTADPAQPREWLVLDAVSGLGVLVLGLWMLRGQFRGGRVTWRDDQAMDWIGGVGLLGLAFALSELAGSLEDAQAARRLEFGGTTLLVGGTLSLLLGRLRRAQLETRVGLVELELRVAELARTAAPSPPDAPASQR